MATKMTDTQDVNTNKRDEDVVEGANVEENTNMPNGGTNGSLNFEVDAAKAAAEEFRQSAGKTINEAIRQVESLGKAFGSALQDRSNVVMVRINDDSLHYLDMMVEADVAKSRSEAAAFLINEGIKANEELFHTIRDISDQISALKTQLRETMQN